MEASTSTGRPLWRTVLFVILSSVALHRGAAAYIAWDGGLGAGLALGLAVQSAAALGAAIGVLLGRAWVLGFVAALGVSAVATALLLLGQGAVAGISALSAGLVLGLGTVALYLFLRHELVRGPSSGGGR
jgi:hypothetical protein